MKQFMLVSLSLLAVMFGCSSSDDGTTEDDNLLGGEAAIDDGDANAVAAISYSGWKPEVTTTWQWQLLGDVNIEYDVAVYDIDLFDVPQTTIDQLHTVGRKVMCYFSGGSFEEWRDDAGDFPEVVLGKGLDGWEGERWLDIRSASVRQIMAARLDLAVSRQCDGVEPDNMDGYTNDSGFDMTGAHQLAYNRWLAERGARARAVRGPQK